MPGPYAPIEELLQRQGRISALPTAGASLEAMAAEFGCNREVMRQALIRMDDERARVNVGGWLAGLPLRTARAVLSAGYTSRDHLRAAVGAGQVTAHNTPQLGPRSFAVLLEWLAYEPPAPPSQQSVSEAIALLQGLRYRVTARRAQINGP